MRPWQASIIGIGIALVEKMNGSNLLNHTCLDRKIFLCFYILRLKRLVNVHCFITFITAICVLFVIWTLG